jgi:uracil-DNA glycosylase family 4
MTPLEVLTNGILSCSRCSLRKPDEEPVPGVGAVGGLLVIGDYPGTESSLFARPFEDRSGQVVRRLLEQAGIPNSSTRFTYAIRCRPDSKTPTQLHVRTCASWLLEEVSLAKPKVIVGMGLISTKVLGLKKTKDKLSDIVGRFSVTHGVTAVAWHSPSTIMNGGRKIDASTLSLFCTIKELL